MLETALDSGMELTDITSGSAFHARPSRVHHPEATIAALTRLARAFATPAEDTLQELTDVAVRVCGADSAGISLEVPSETRFRWVAVSGTFSKYIYGTTPRFFSPCGVCLDRNIAQHYRVTKPYYDFLGIEADPIIDGILIPWSAKDLPDGNARGTFWAVSHESHQAFDEEDLVLLNSLADFTAAAYRHSALQQAALRNAQAFATASMANELAHRINNPLQILTNSVYLAAQGGAAAQEFARQASRELKELASLVNSLLGDRHRDAS